MDTVTVSPKYQVVIPQAVRERLGIVPGQRVQMIPYGDRIEVIPVRPAAALRGFARGTENDFKREGDRL